MDRQEALEELRDEYVGKDRYLVDIVNEIYNDHEQEIAELRQEFQAKISEINLEHDRKVDDIKRMRDIQRESVTDGYMQGLYNGLEFALSIVESREPIFLDADVYKDKR